MSTTPNDPSSFPDDAKGDRIDTGGDHTTAGHPQHRGGYDEVRHTRAAATWTGLIIGIVVLIVLLIFILQNLDSTPLHFLGWQTELPLGVALLFAAIAGAIIVALAGGIRILQIRRAAKRR
ncbi:DUF1049 domain-containing protein [Rhodococcus rhodnii]|uniref:Lipopolysaccharide assembly protein A domain-containing protein n=2 Tax=Rhodococcus rhodnii TaxID=38312 RepID=R7WL27_9NOCA|nr:lipopolysaccharide assembly protein LapA domain-containing protein [Rhodococcus rhodnii]EOM76003.1 hypothetical protein Rrhod_2651 [Rhodococcus rhodnii LMG 5362]TXG90844.1 DUF1049 domain-containing protein [Rhodococcus rhodnii]